MRERVASLGGSVKRLFEDGTTLTVTFPIAASRQEQQA
jgi:signal transduction histidine kinase